MQSDVSTVDLTSETKVDIDLVQGVWTRVDTIFENNYVTIRNVGGTSVSAYLNRDSSFEVSDENFTALGIDPLEIGGLIYEISNIDGEEVWVKANESTGRVSVRILGTISPDEDIVKQATLLNSTIVQLETHMRDKTNPHSVTKKQIGLDKIPNDISDSITDNSSNKLATSKAVKTVQDNLNNHTSNESNPHKTTKEHVGLGNVDNYTTATLTNCTDTTLHSVFMTPMTTFEAVSKWTGMTTSVAAQSVVKGSTNAFRPDGWGDFDCSPSIATVVKPTNSDKLYTVKSGLQVGYADKGKVRVSIETTKDFECQIPDDYYESGFLYVFVDINDDGEIIAAAHTNMCPSEGMVRISGSGDFFNVSECVMYNSVNTPIKRVYISKLVTTEGRITDIINVPIGYDYIAPFDRPNLDKGYRGAIDNPFISEIIAEAEVQFEGNPWGPSYWNDQIGVKASPDPFDSFNNCIVQCGLMGFLAPGEESGAPFTRKGVTVTDPKDIRIRVRFTKRYR